MGEEWRYRLSAQVDYKDFRWAGEATPNPVRLQEVRRFSEYLGVATLRVWAEGRRLVQMADRRTRMTRGAMTFGIVVLLLVFEA